MVVFFAAGRLKKTIILSASQKPFPSYFDRTLVENCFNAIELIIDGLMITSGMILLGKTKTFVHKYQGH